MHLVVIVHSMSNFILFFRFSFCSSFFFFFIFFFSFFVDFCLAPLVYDAEFGTFLDWTENDSGQFEENLSLPAMRPSKLPANPSDHNTFMGAFMRHLQQGTDTKVVASVPPTVEKKPASKIVKAKVPREPKKPRKKKKDAAQAAVPVSPPKCTTIGLQIQIHDPINEPPTATPLETSFESDTAIYPFSQECQEDVVGVGAAMMTMSTPPPPPPPLTQNPISNTMVELSPSVAAPSNQHHTSTYYNLDQSRADEYIMYDPDPATYGQPMNMMPTMISPHQLENIPLPSEPQPPSPTLTPLQTAPIHLGNSVMPQNQPSYGIQLLNYSDQNNSSAALISHFNVAHTNVNNTSAVCDPVHNNWRPINEIMLNK